MNQLPPPRDLIDPDMSPSAAVATVVETLSSHFSPLERRHARQLVEQLKEPLRVALVGNSNAGKSTMVNALVGHKVAPTDQLPCTRFVAWYSHAEREDWAMVRLLNENRQIRIDWPPSAERLTNEVTEAAIDDIRVYRRDTRRLRWLTVIDTPGQNDPNKSAVARTTRLLNEHAIDAVIFMLDGKVFDKEEHRVFSEIRHALTRDAIGRMELVPANTVIVLNRVDYTHSADPFGGAAKIMRQHAAEFRELATTVIPMIGRLAEAAAVLTEDDYATLRELVGAAGSPRPDTTESRRHLTTLLGPYGFTFALRQIHGGNVDSAAQLKAKLLDESHIADLDRALDARFAIRKDALKAYTAIRQLLKLSRRSGLRPLRPYLLYIQHLPGMHTLDEFKAYELWAGGKVRLPNEFGAAITKLALESALPARLGLGPAASLDDIEKTALAQLRKCAKFLAEPYDAGALETVGIMRQSYSHMLDAVERQRDR